MENSIVKAIIDLSKCGKNKPVKYYHILYGASKLLALDETVIVSMFDSAITNQELEDCREVYNTYSLDMKLIRNHLSMFYNFFDKIYTEVPKVDFINYDKPLPSLIKLCIESLHEEDLVSFKKGTDSKDVFEHLHTLENKIKQEKPEQQDNKPASNTDNNQPKTEETTNEEVTFASLSNQFKDLRIGLLKDVKGQNDVIKEFIQGLYQSSLIDDNSDRSRPKASFLFVGPPGTGKTFLAQKVATYLGYPTKTFNMSEYTSHQSHESLIGVSSFYNNSEEGELVKFVRQNPKCILIFDEIEKAHLNTIQLFLQILDLGTLENTHRKELTSFKDAIIIFTSNACKKIYEYNYSNISRTPKNVIIDALKNEINPNTGSPVFPTAIVSRLAAGNIIMFNNLSSKVLIQMVSDNFEKTGELIKQKYNINLSFDDKLPLLFMYHYGSMMDARIANLQSSKFIKNEIFELSRLLESNPDLMDGVERVHLDLDLTTSKVSDEIKSLFSNSESFKVVMMCNKKDQSTISLPSNYEIQFVYSVDEMLKAVEDDPNIVIIDLRYGLTDDSKYGISLDDYDCIGVNSFKALQRSQLDIPIYLFESEVPYKVVDSSSFINEGAFGIISNINASSTSINRQIEQACELHYMEKLTKEFSKRGYVLSYSTSQVKNGNELYIHFYDLRKTQALDSENANVFLSDAEKPKERFNDVIGASNAKEELRYYINYLSNPKKFIKEGGKPAKGVLLYGPPGTGKTMLARAMAGESNVSFIQTSATTFLSKWVGESEENVRNLFARAKKHSPTIIFIDEIDAIGKQRKGESAVESTLNALLTELDGFVVDVKNPVFVLAATNYQIEGNSNTVLDQALVRRFDNRICVDLPNEEERIQFLNIQINKKQFEPMDEEIVKNIATRTAGLSIAILKNVVDLAFRNAKKESRIPTGLDLQNALEEYNFGEKKDWGEDYYKSVAIHESGHAYISYLSGEKPSYLTIESRGNFGGYMAHENSEKKPSLNKEEFLWRIRCALGGRVAEEVFYGKEYSLNTGASSDLRQATNLALAMLCDYGMMEGQLIALPFETILKSPLVITYIEKANQIIKEQMDITLQLMIEGKDKVQTLANQLVKENHLTTKQIIEALK